MLKSMLKKNLNLDQKRGLKKFYEFVTPIFCPANLVRLATIYGTDKWNTHWYAQHYQTHFKSLRKKLLKIFEIGAGGDSDTKSGGASLRMWKKYFPNSLIYSLDIHDKTALEEPRIKIFRGCQSDESVLKNIHDLAGSFDIVIDDGSHINAHVIKTFQLLFPLLKEGGIYVAEDLQTSYWPSYGGDSVNLNHPGTSMGFFKSLVDGLNYVEFEGGSPRFDYCAKNIKAMHFYHNMVFIYKGKNSETSYGTR